MVLFGVWLDPSVIWCIPVDLDIVLSLDYSHECHWVWKYMQMESYTAVIPSEIGGSREAVQNKCFVWVEVNRICLFVIRKEITEKPNHSQNKCFASLKIQRLNRLTKTEVNWTGANRWMSTTDEIEFGSNTHFSLVICLITVCAWRRHQMQTISALLALCAGNSPFTGESPSRRPVTWSFDVFFDLRLNKRLTKQSRRGWFETP